MIVIKFIAIVLASLSIAKSYLDYRRKFEPQPMFIFWSVIWLTAATIIVYPSLIDHIVAYSQDRTITVSSLIALAFIFLLYIIYRIYTKAARIEYQQSELIRKLGLKSSFKKPKQ